MVTGHQFSGLPCLQALTKTILSIWSFKRKRGPDGTLLKHEAHLWAHGATILMAIAHIHDLPTRSVDFVIAFPQAPLDVDDNMEVLMDMSVLGSFTGQYVLK